MIDRFVTPKPSGGYEHTFLSNGFIEPDGSFVEREYQAYSKTEDPKKRTWILDAKRPFGKDGAKGRGRSVLIRADHDEVKFQVMSFFVVRKFTEWKELATALLDTGAQLLVEGNDWHDNVWGDCRCENADGKHPECIQSGQNWLGLILMTTREMVRRAWQPQARPQ